MTLRMKFAMMSTTSGWMDETYTDFQTERNGSETTTTYSAAEFASARPSLPLSFKIALLICGFLGTLTNGFVLAGIRRSGQSTKNCSTVHIANHTTLGLVASLMITVRYALDMAGAFTYGDNPGPAKMALCLLVDGSGLIAKMALCLLVDGSLSVSWLTARA